MASRKFIVIGFLLLLHISFTINAAEPAGRTFKEFLNEIPGRVMDLIIEDIDEDGLKDIFVVYVEGDYPNAVRGITVIFQTEEGFSGKSRQDIVVEENVALTDLGQVDGLKGLDIVCYCRGSVSYYPLRGRTFGNLTKFADARPFTAFGDEGFLPYYDFMQDWNKDGKDELLLFEFEKSYIFTTGPNGLIPEGHEIMLPVHVSINIGGPERIFQEHHALRAFYFLPQLNATDYDGDGLVDLVASDKAKLTVFLQLEDGTFSREPINVIQLNLPKAESKEGKKRMGEPPPPMLQVDDVNGDGRMDIIVSQLSGGFGDLTSRTYIFYGHTDSLKKNQPDQLIEKSKAASFPLLRDLDGNKTLDLVLPSVDVGIFNIARMIITSSVNVNFSMYTINKDGEYPVEPTAQDTTYIKFNIRELTVEGGVPNVDGDFNNDDINDVVRGLNSKELQVSLGLGQGVFDKAAWATIPVPAPLFPDVADLNKDGLADVVVSYIPYTDNDHKVYIFLNKTENLADVNASPPVGSK